MAICNKCVLDESIPNFILNKIGHCNYCEHWEKNKYNFINKSKKIVDELLSNILSEVKNYTKKNQNKYDCILGLSGGTDSSYVAYNLWKMGLNPLVIHLDNSWNTLTSNSNISKILEKTNFDFKTLVLDWEEFKDLQLSFLKASVPDTELVTDHAIFAYIQNFAIKNKIKYIFSGVNFATEHSIIPEWGWRKDDFGHISAIHRKYGSKKLSNYPKSYIFKKFLYENILRKIKVINLLDIINYNSSEAKKILIKEFDWSEYGGKHEESFFTMFFQKYILPVKFNIDKRKIHYSCLIRNSELTRDKALELLKFKSYEYSDFNRDKNFFLKKLSLTQDEFNKIISEIPKKHSDYSKDWSKNIFIKILKKIIR